MIAIGGENLIDLVQTGLADGLPQMRAIPGGSCYNCARAAARQGAEVVYLTPISTDAMGDLLARQLAADGVRLAAPRVAAPTTLALVSLRDGQPSYGFYRTGTAERAVTPEGLRKSWPSAAGIFHIGSLALSDGPDAQAWEDAFLAAHAAGVLTTLDPNIRPAMIPDALAHRARLERMMRAAGVVKLSDEDLAHLWPDLQVQDAPAALAADSGAALVVVTQGALGALGWFGGQTFAIPGTPARPFVDSVGAGDTFMGTLIAGLDRLGIASAASLSALPPSAISALLDRACRAAALNCQSAGCTPPFADDL